MATKAHFTPNRRARFAVLAMLLPLLNLGAAGCQSGDTPQDWLANTVDSFSPPTPQEAARDAFNMYDADRRRRAIALLSAAPFGGEDAYVRTYRLLLDDPDATVRAACAKALGMHGSVEDVQRLTPLLQDQNALVRWESAKALQRIHDPAAIDPLIRAVQHDEDADVRMAAAKALGQYAQPRVFDVLLGTLNDHDFGVVAAAHESLVTLTGQDLGTDSRDWLAWSQDHRATLFAHQQRYTYQPYQAPPGLLQRVQFWQSRAVAETRAPVGLEDDGAVSERPSSS